MHTYKKKLEGIGEYYQIETVYGDILVLVKFLDGTQELFIHSGGKILTSIVFVKEEVKLISNLLLINI